MEAAEISTLRYFILGELRLESTGIFVAMLKLYSEAQLLTRTDQENGRARIEPFAEGAASSAVWNSLLESLLSVYGRR
jgi:hypothetical protein